MSQIDELIAELCPEGVPFKPLGSIVDRNVGGGTPSKARSDYWNGDIPWASVGDITATSLKIDSTRQFITSLGLDSSSSNIVPEGWVIVAVKIAPGQMRVVEGDIAVNQDIRGLHVVEEMDPYFLAYYFQTINVVGNGTIVKGITNQALLRILIPVPPLEIQREIVRILDTFSKMEAELEAELEARKQQYVHYLNSLITANAAPRVAMGELGSFVRGRRFTKNDVVDSGIPSIHYGEIYTHYGVFASSALREVRSDLSEQLRFAQTRDVIFAGVGETVEDVGKAVAWLGESPVAIHDDTFAFTTDLDSKYVAYAAQADEFQSQKVSFVARGKVKRLSSKGLQKMAIPVPPMDEQRRIVDILDKFDALVNDLAVGLPAELNARRQQYEHYRDKLLTFKELEVTS